ncbi:hypothetical protein MRB53_040982 [Persea americana]|nr:hypothetical protein MRB53_040982 [Persea americana]
MIMTLKADFPRYCDLTGSFETLFESDDPMYHQQNSMLLLMYCSNQLQVDRALPEICHSKGEVSRRTRDAAATSPIRRDHNLLLLNIDQGRVSDIRAIGRTAASTDGDGRRECIDGVDVGGEQEAGGGWDRVEAAGAMHRVEYVRPNRR